MSVFCLRYKQVMDHLMHSRQTGKKTMREQLLSIFPYDDPMLIPSEQQCGSHARKHRDQMSGGRKFVLKTAAALKEHVTSLSWPPDNGISEGATIPQITDFQISQLPLTSVQIESHNQVCSHSVRLLYSCASLCGATSDQWLCE